jgi:LPS-assembly protein
MKRSDVYRFVLSGVVCAPLLAGAGVLGLGLIPGTPAQAATDGVGSPQPDKPLGTLWYPGPYDPNATPPAPVKGPVLAPVQTPIPTPGATTFPAPAAGGAPQPGKPLGTLWYPGAYDAARPRPAPLPAPVLTPQPAPPGALPLAPVQYGKPLGTLWYPGPYDAKAPSRVVPAPAQAPRMATPVPADTTAPVRAQPAPAPAAPGTVAAPKGASDEIDPEIPVHLSADEMSFDEEQGLVIANGNVQIINAGRRLLADHVSYNQKTDMVTATGNLQLTEPGGERIFAERMEISGDLKDAIIKGLGIILTDRSRIAATGARRSAGTVTEMRQGVYSPCNLCQTDPTKPPLWQIKAVKVIHDKNSRTIEYRDAWLEVLGVPVAYTPYLSHPDPTVKRQSGFLAPAFGGSSDLGLVGRIPYFFNLGPYRDATVTALVTGNEGSGGSVEYRHRFNNGTLDATASLILGDNEKDFRGHILTNGRFDIDDTWRWGFDLNGTLDDTYMRRYGFGSPASLNSRLFTEGFRRRNYFSVNAYTFQGLRAADDPDTEPLVLPLIDYNHLGRPDRFGGQTILDVNFLAITREEGTDTRRLSIRPGWQLPFVDNLGGVYKFSAGLNVDLYQVDHLARSGKNTYSGLSGRVVPQVVLDWRMPFVKNTGNVSQVIEPIAVAIYSPYGGNSTKIPNEDSSELEFDDTNLFSANKFTGLDRVEGGPRFAYGVKWGAYGKDGGNSGVFIGQSVRLKTDDTFAVGSGLVDKFSDIVGRVNISPGPYLNLLYRTRLDGDNFIPKRNELKFSAGGAALRGNVNYVFIEAQRDSEFPGREEINFSINSKLNRFWRAGFSGTHDLVAGEARVFNASLVYENECVIFTTKASRTFFEDRDIEPTDQITFNLLLKTLGEIRTDIFQQ